MLPHMEGGPLIVVTLATALALVLLALMSYHPLGDFCFFLSVQLLRRGNITLNKEGVLGPL